MEGRGVIRTSRLEHDDAGKVEIGKVFKIVVAVGAVGLFAYSCSAAKDLEEARRSQAPSVVDGSTQESGTSFQIEPLNLPGRSNDRLKVRVPSENTTVLRIRCGQNGEVSTLSGYTEDLDRIVVLGGAFGDISVGRGGLRPDVDFASSDGGLIVEDQSDAVDREKTTQVTAIDPADNSFTLRLTKFGNRPGYNVQSACQLVPLAPDIPTRAESAPSS